jgi:23S rRNA pseudouridine1911/1915/1917 synthase
MKRQALHAARISFIHPVTLQDFTFSSPLPHDMAELCSDLREYCTK